MADKQHTMHPKSSSVLPGSLADRSRSASSLAGSVLASLTVLVAACSGPTDPPPPLPIPEQLYDVDLATSTNDCGAENVEGFKTLLLPLMAGTEILGLLESGVTSSVSGDRLSFSVPIPLEGDTVVTLGAEWIFAEDRHTFDGPTTFAVSFGDPVICTFTLAAHGNHAETSNEPTQPSGEGAPAALIGTGTTQGTRDPHANSGPKLATSVAEVGWTWGRAGQVRATTNSVCFTFTNTQTASITAQAPAPIARDAIPGQRETDRVWFSYQIFVSPDPTTATLSQQLTNLSGDPVSGATHEYTSGWYKQYTYDNQILLYGNLYGPPEWFQPNETPWSRSNESGQWELPKGSGTYFIVTWIYWENRSGVGDGWYRVSSGVPCSA